MLGKGVAGNVLGFLAPAPQLCSGFQEVQTLSADPPAVLGIHGQQPHATEDDINSESLCLFLLTLPVAYNCDV